MWWGPRGWSRRTASARAAAVASGPARRASACSTGLPGPVGRVRRRGPPRCGTRRRRRRTRTACARRPSPSRARNCGSSVESASGSRPAEDAARAPPPAGTATRIEVDEAALVAAAAPVVEALGGVEVEGPVAAVDHAVERGRGRRSARPPTARCGPAAARSSAGPASPSASASTARKPSSNAALFDHWWFTTRPSTSRLPLEADHSFDMTTEAPSVEHGDEHGDGRQHAGDRHVAVEHGAGSAGSQDGVGSSSRSARRTGRPVAAAARSMASKRSPPGWRRTGRRPPCARV